MAEKVEEAKEAKAPETSKKKYKCITKCYAGDRVWNPGDTCEGLDLSKNGNFELVK